MMKLTMTLVAITACAAVALAQGQDTEKQWDRHCAICHSKDGKGNTKMGRKLKLPDLTKAEVQSSFKDEKAFQAIKEGIQENGRTKMKSYADKFSDQEIHDLVAFIRTLKKPE